MAGYMTKLQGYVYEGELVNGTGAAVENGVLLAHGTGANVGKLVKPTTNTGTKFIVKEAGVIYNGMTAYRVVVEALAAPLYLVENGFEVDQDGEFDTTAYATADGALLRAHPLQVGDEFVTNMVTGTPSLGAEVTIKADGTIG